MDIKAFVKKAIAVLGSKYRRTNLYAHLGFYNKTSDEKYIKKQFKNVFGYEPDLNNPKTYSEKLQWLKLYDRNPFYTMLVDKAAAKEYISEKVGEQYVVETFGVWDSFDEIDFDALPNQFVLKCTHDSGGIVICKDKSKFKKASAKAKLKRRLKTNFFIHGREWPYKNVKPRIIAEKFLEEISRGDFYEYKIFCFEGEIKMLLVCKGEFLDSTRTIDYCDPDFNRLPFYSANAPSTGKIDIPEQKEELFDIARKLAKGLPHVRIDMYLSKNKIYVGEMTMFHGSGFQPFDPKEWDEIIGGWLKLPNKTE